MVLAVGAEAGLEIDSLAAGLDSEAGFDSDLESDLESADAAGVISEAGLSSLLEDGREA